jgi:hypothetical protein
MATKPGAGLQQPGGGYADGACICPSINNLVILLRIKLNRRCEGDDHDQEGQEAFR